jgi:tRNA pseudouridine55 synthase
MTSHDVVARIRRLAHTRRVGHAGTLDPMATGVLVIGIEKATRLLGHLMLTEKTYEATIRLGQSTTTDDAEGEPTGTALRPATEVTREALDQEIAKLTGEILQVPSSVSAIKVNGQRAYTLTRAGQAPELAARPVTIYEFRVTAIRARSGFLDVDATIRCSSGTYIRALARDLGKSLATGAHLTALRRTAVGPYTLAQAHPLKTLEDQGQDQKQSSERVPPAPEAHATLQPPEGAGAGAASPSPNRSVKSRARPAPLIPDSRANPHALPGPDALGGVPGTSPEPPVSPVTPLAEAAAAAFPRLDLTEDEARRLAQGARLPLPASWPRGPQGSNRPGPVAPGTISGGPVAHRDNDDPALSATGPEPEDPASGISAREPAPGTPIAAFAPDGTLVALVSAERGQIRSLAVFVGQ